MPQLKRKNENINLLPSVRHFCRCYFWSFDCKFQICLFGFCVALSRCSVSLESDLIYEYSLIAIIGLIETKIPLRFVLLWTLELCFHLISMITRHLSRASFKHWTLFKQISLYTHFWILFLRSENLHFHKYVGLRLFDGSENKQQK